MDNKKRMMFILEEDYYYITIKILSILRALECDKKSFHDYRKLGIIFEFIKNDNNFRFLSKILTVEQNDLFDNEVKVKIYCDSKLNVAVFKRVLFFLEKQEMVKLEKNIKNSAINISLIESDSFKVLVEEKILEHDILKCIEIKKMIPRIRTLKLETLQEKIFGYSEGEKWEN